MKKAALLASILALAFSASAQTFNHAGCAATGAGKSMPKRGAISPTAPTKPVQDPPPPRFVDGGAVVPAM